MNYKSNTETGEVYTRCFNVTVNNPLNAVPTVNMMEETVFSIAGKTITQPGRFLQKTFVPTETIDLVNPESGEPIGQSVTHQELYVMLFSLWLATAQEHDAAELAFEPIPAEELPPNPESE